MGFTLIDEHAGVRPATITVDYAVLLGPVGMRLDQERLEEAVVRLYLALQFIVLRADPRLPLIGHQLGHVETGPAGTDDGATEPPFETPLSSWIGDAGPVQAGSSRLLFRLTGKRRHDEFDLSDDRFLSLARLSRIN